MSTVDVIGAAKLMKVHPKTVVDLINQGAFPAAKIGRAYVMMERHVLDYIEEQIRKQTAERLGLPADYFERRDRRGRGRKA